MVKNIQLKIILSFMILGILIITALGCFNAYIIKELRKRNYSWRNDK